MKILRLKMMILGRPGATDAAAAELERKHEKWAEQRSELISSYRRVRTIGHRYIPAAEWGGPISGLQFCAKSHEMCNENDDFFIENDGFCIENALFLQAWRSNSMRSLAWVTTPMIWCENYEFCIKCEKSCIKNEKCLL